MPSAREIIVGRHYSATFKRLIPGAIFVQYGVLLAFIQWYTADWHSGIVGRPDLAARGDILMVAYLFYMVLPATALGFMPISYFILPSRRRSVLASVTVAIAFLPGALIGAFVTVLVFSMFHQQYVSVPYTPLPGIGAVIVGLLLCLRLRKPGAWLAEIA